MIVSGATGYHCGSCRQAPTHDTTIASECISLMEKGYISIQEVINTSYSYKGNQRMNISALMEKTAAMGASTCTFLWVSSDCARQQQARACKRNNGLRGILVPDCQRAYEPVPNGLLLRKTANVTFQFQCPANTDFVSMHSCKG